MKKKKTRNERPKLSDLERQVMQIIWSLGKANSRQIKEVLDPERPLALNTIITVLKRLQTKDYIKEIPRIGRLKVYKPKVPREQVARRSLQSLLNGLYRGSAASMVAQLLKTENIKEDELEEIRRMLDENMDSRKKK